MEKTFRRSAILDRAHANVCGIDVHPDDGILDGLRVQLGPHHRVGLARRQMEYRLASAWADPWPARRNDTYMAEPIPTPELQPRRFPNHQYHPSVNSTRHRASQSPFLAARTILRTWINDIDGPAASTVAPALPIPYHPRSCRNTADRCHRAAHDRDFPPYSRSPRQCPRHCFRPGRSEIRYCRMK